MPSIEILVEQPRQSNSINLGCIPFRVDVSNPPKSNREPSHWQPDFAKIGGILYHIGNSKEEATARFFCYDLIEENDAQRYSFLPKYREAICQVIMKLVESSNAGRIHYTSDWQFGPKKFVKEARELAIDVFKQKIMSGQKIRFNQWLTLQKKCINANV